MMTMCQQFKWTWLLEKTVVLSSNFLSDTTGVSTTQLAALLKEKASFLQKDDKSLFRKEFTDNLAETIKAKKQFLETITEVSIPKNCQPFRVGPSN